MKHTSMFIVALCAVAGLLFLSARTDASTLYGATSAGGAGELYILDPTTAAVVQDIGPLHDASNTNYPMTGLAFNPNTGVLYGSTGNSQPGTAARLVTIDPATALVTVIGQFNTGNGASMADIDFTSTGDLYGISTNGGASLYSVNQLTGQATLVGPSGFTLTAGGGLAISSGGVFYATPEANNFGTYDPTTGAYTNIGTPGHPAGAGTGYAALAYDQNGVLYGDDLGATPHLVTFNVSDGSITDLGTSVAKLDAIAFTVPEPASLALLLVPAVLGVFTRRREGDRRPA